MLGRAFFKDILVFLVVLFPLPLLAAQYPMPKAGNDIIGRLTSVVAQPGDTLDGLGDQNGIGSHEISEANPSLPNELSGGEEIIIPTQFVLPKYRKGIVINMAECRLYYFTPDGRWVYTYPVGLGRRGWRTPTTSSTVVRKAIRPVWNVPASIRAHIYRETGDSLPNAVQPGPENPLGPYALYLGTRGYLIHGTNQPWTIGKLLGAGCIRMHNADVTELYQNVKVGTPVKIIHQPYKAGWQNGALYLEAHIPVWIPELPSELNMLSVERAVLSVTHDRGNVDWRSIRRIARQQDGIPEPVNGNREYAQESNDSYSADEDWG